MRAVPYLSASVLALAAVASTVPASEPPPTNNWNQWDEPLHRGVAAGSLKLSIGGSYVATPVYRTWPLELESEYLVSDRWGMRGTLSLPVHARGDALWVPWVSAGPVLHLLPRHTLDPFVSLRAGLAWPFDGGGGTALSPLVGATAGAAFYYWGVFFVQAEGGYQLTHFAGPARTVDISGAVASLRFGVAL